MYLQNNNPGLNEFCDSSIHKQSVSEYYYGNPFLYKTQSQIQAELAYKAELDARVNFAGLRNFVDNAEPSISDRKPELSVVCERKEFCDYLMELSGNGELLDIRDSAELEAADIGDSERLSAVLGNSENAGDAGESEDESEPEDSEDA